MRTALESFLLEHGNQEPDEVSNSKATNIRPAGTSNKTMESFFTPQPLVTENGEATMHAVARYGRIYKRKAPNQAKPDPSKIACPAGILLPALLIA